MSLELFSCSMTNIKKSNDGRHYKPGQEQILKAKKVPTSAHCQKSGTGIP